MEDSGQLHAPAALPWGKNPGTFRVGGRVGPKIGLVVAAKEISALAGNRTPPTVVGNLRLTPEYDVGLQNRCTCSVADKLPPRKGAIVYVNS
jgi:hypothetical protein